MPLKLFNQTVTHYLTLDNTVASAGMAATGGQGAGTYNSGDTYAPGDARSVFGSDPTPITRKGKKKKKRKKK